LTLKPPYTIFLFGLLNLSKISVKLIGSSIFPSGPAAQLSLDIFLFRLLSLSDKDYYIYRKSYQLPLRFFSKLPPINALTTRSHKQQIKPEISGISTFLEDISEFKNFIQGKKKPGRYKTSLVNKIKLSLD
jgi:hypothetical protein